MLSYCVPEDAATMAKIYVDAFLRDPTYQVMYGQVSTQDLLAHMRKTFSNGMIHRIDPESKQERHCLKMTDDETKEIVAFVIWTDLPEGYTVEQDPQTRVTNVTGACESLRRDAARILGELRSCHSSKQEPHWREFPPPMEDTRSAIFSFHYTSNLAIYFK